VLIDVSNTHNHVIKSRCGQVKDIRWGGFGIRSTSLCCAPFLCWLFQVWYEVPTWGLEAVKQQLKSPTNRTVFLLASWHVYSSSLQKAWCNALRSELWLSTCW
jgi:hypothetical protein